MLNKSYLIAKNIFKDFIIAYNYLKYEDYYETQRNYKYL